MSRARLLTDEDINRAILAGLRLHHPEIDTIGAREVRLARTPDPRVLDWAAANLRVVVSHDVKTMPPAARSRLATGKPMPGLILVPQWYRVGLAIEDIAELVERSEAEPLDGLIEYLPLDKSWRVREEEAVWAKAGVRHRVDRRPGGQVSGVRADGSPDRRRRRATKPTEAATPA